VDEINLTDSEQERYDVVSSCIEGEITNKEASVRLGLKIRWVQMLKRAVEKDGKKGVVHKSKGQAPPNATSKIITEKVVTFFEQKKHQDFGPTFAQEKLVDIGVNLNLETLRLLMIKEKLWKLKPRRGPQVIHEWRERKESFGELVQFDGSYHDWFEDGGEQCLLAAIDDATSKIVQAVFDDNEGVHAVFRFWIAYMEAYGRPRAIYLDKFSTYKVNHKNAVDNKEFMTQFQRAMDELDVEVITANSPEAKGRVERLFGTLQDRMVKEMRLRDMKERDEANLYIYQNYIPDHDRRFSVAAKNPTDVHRPLTDDLKARLSSIFSIQSRRRVNNDYTIQFKTSWFQLEPTKGVAVYKRDEVIIEERLDDTIHIRLKAKYLKYRILPERPKPTYVPIVALTAKKPIPKPPKDHPWRRWNS
jgi:hypothetical protein